MSYPYQNYPQNPGAGQPQSDPMQLPYGIHPQSAAIGFNMPAPAPPYPANTFWPSATPYPVSTGYPMPQQHVTPNPMPPYPSSQSSFPNTSGMGPYPNASAGPYPNTPSVGHYPNAPSVGQYPNTPSVGQYTNAPSVGQYPNAPTVGPYPNASSSMASYPQDQSMGYTPRISDCPPIQPHAPAAHSEQYLSKSHSGQVGSHAPTPSNTSMYPRVSVSPTLQQSSHGGAPAKSSHRPVSEHHTKSNPTIVPAADFNPRGDAEGLRKAMKGFGTDEKAIINILAKKCNLQRQEIATHFKTLYGKDLIKDLKGELSGRFEELVLACVTPLPQFYAKELHDAMSGIGTDEACLVEILATASNHYIQVIRSTYKAMYGKDLENELVGETSGHFKRLMVSLCQGHRDENPVVTPGICAQDAQALYKAGALQLGTDESTFNAILATRSFAHLHQVMVDYERIAGHSLEKAIKREFSGDIEEGLLAIVKAASNRPLFFAERLHKAMAGMGTKDRTLIRIIVTRSEVDLGDIKAEFHRTYGKSLEDFISGDTSGDYKKMLLAMVQ